MANGKRRSQHMRPLPDPQSESGIASMLLVDGLRHPRRVQPRSSLRTESHVVVPIRAAAGDWLKP